jgi:hypothetical protein
MFLSTLLHIKFVLILAISYNQPKFCKTPSWNSTAVTFSNESLVGKDPVGIFIDTHDKIYVANREHGLIQMWQGNDHILTLNISIYMKNPISLFLTITGDMFVGSTNNDIDKWIFTTTIGIRLMGVRRNCYSLFIDNNKKLYCSSSDMRTIIRTLSDRSEATWETLTDYVSAITQNVVLEDPRGFFVNDELILYVSDCQTNTIKVIGVQQCTGLFCAAFALLSKSFPKCYYIHIASSILSKCFSQLSMDHAFLREKKQQENMMSVCDHY